MTKLYIEGELYLHVETVAEVYSVTIVWLEQVCEAGLVHGIPAQGRLCIAAVELDRLAEIVRMNVVLGLDLDAIAALLPD